MVATISAKKNDQALSKKWSSDAKKWSRNAKKYSKHIL